MRVVGLLEVLVLAYLSEEPMYGKELVEKIKNKTRGMWEVSYGSIYPLLRKLHKKGALEVSKEDRKKIYHVTSEGGDYYLRKRQELLNDLTKSLFDHFSLILDVLPREHGWGDAVSRLVRSRNKLYELVQSFPEEERDEARLKIISDLADLLDYYTGEEKNV